jgi:hypothetical protein
VSNRYGVDHDAASEYDVMLLQAEPLVIRPLSGFGGAVTGGGHSFPTTRKAPRRGLAMVGDD